MYLYSNRLTQLKEKLEKLKVACLLVLKKENVRYLSGFTGNSGLLVVGLEDIFLLTDFRYIEQAELEAKNIQIVSYKVSSTEVLGKVLAEIKAKVVSFESHVFTVDYFERIKPILRGMSFRSSINLVENIRAVKDDDEIEKIKKASEIGDKTFEHILSFIKEGVSEKDLAIELEYFMLKNKAEKESFDIIVAFGERSSMPHALVTEKRLKSGDFIKLDFGAVFQGYHSDMTRTLVFGRANPKQKEIYEAVKQAQRASLETVKSGVKAEEIDAVARNLISKAGLGKFFGHGLGHGVGLEVHELPTLKVGSRDILENGMVFTIEPGVYIPSFGGVRIEDLVVLRNGGVEVLTKSPKELIEL